jgi:VanZ family protein
VARPITVKAVFWGFLLSTAIEVSQIWIPGRDPSLSDFVFNTAGTVFGALLGLHPQSWLHPDAETPSA